MPKKKPRKQSRARAREEDDSIGGMISNATRELKKIWSNPLYRVFGVMILSQILSNRLEEKSVLTDEQARAMAKAPGGAWSIGPSGKMTPISHSEAAAAVAAEQTALGQDPNERETEAEFEKRAKLWQR